MMWAAVGLSGLRARLLSVSHQISPFPFHYSISSISTDTANDEDIKNKSRELMVNYLINSVGLSRDEAISASSKVNHFKSTQNPDLVINILKHVGGLDQTQIKDLVFSIPKVLLHRPDETLESKIRVFQDLGLTGSHLVKLFKTDSRILKRGLITSIIPTITYLRDVLGGCDDKVVKALCSSQQIFSSNPAEVFSPKIKLLKNYGVSQENIERILIKSARVLRGKPERLQEILDKIEVEWGIPGASCAFLHAIYALTKLRSSTLETKFDVFRSFGWSDSDILSLARTMAGIFLLSESALRLRLHFFMEELGYTPAYLASHPAHFSCSLEKRVKPRHEVLKILKGCKLVKCDMSFYSVILMTEVKFVEKFVLPYKDEVTDLYEIYANSKKQRLEA